MKVVGIVAEYNPFHNGHKYQIDYAKNTLNADYVIVAMSGPFTQRGTIACYDKYTRSHAALLNGADIVLEIPVMFATASAREFSSAAVELLNSTGIVDTILFGAENADKELFLNTANKIINIEKTQEYQNKIAISMSEGKSFAQARIDATSDLVDTSLFESSNNILGFEYTKYILENNLNIEIECLKREGNSYNDQELQDSFSSASAIRNAIFLNTGVAAYIPDNTLELYENDTFIEDNSVSQLLHYKLLTNESFVSFLDCNNDISDRINNIKRDYTDFKSFCELLTTKNISKTRASRILCHILLDIKTCDFNQQKEKGYISYLRLLGFSRHGSNALALIKEYGMHPLVTAPPENVLYHDILASDIRRVILTSETTKVYPNEYTRKFTLANI